MVALNRKMKKNLTEKAKTQQWVVTLVIMIIVYYSFKSGFYSTSVDISNTNTVHVGVTGPNPYYAFYGFYALWLPYCMLLLQK